MIRKRPTEDEKRVIVAFEVPGSVWAERINLVGDFNGWDRESLPFGRNRDENWYVELELEEGCEVRFRYLVNGDYWSHDWQADRHVPGTDGACDSIVVASIHPAMLLDGK